MKRIISMLLAALMVITGLYLPVFAEDAAGITTITEDIFSVEGATVEYDSYLSSYKITPSAAGETVVVRFTDYSYYFAIWLPATAADEELPVTLETEMTIGEAVLTRGHKFWTLGFSTIEDGGCVFSYAPSDVYSIYLFDKMADKENFDELDRLANGSLALYEEEYLDLDTYDVERYTKPYWDGDIVFNESFMVIEEKDGTIAPNAMMYEIDRVVSVKNSYLNVEYVYGVDYLIEDGKLVIPEGSSIRSYAYNTVYKDTSTGNDGFWKTLGGSYVYAGQHNMYFTGYLNITYTPKDSWAGPVPENKGEYLPNVTAKLYGNGNTVKILGIGDSIAGGANVSSDIGDTGVSPYADPWCEMTCKAIQEKYPEVTIDYSVIAQGGATATLAIERMNEIIEFAPDLLMIEFGTNECMAGESDEYYINTLVQAIEAVNENLPECDIILVAPIISNPLIFPTDWFYSYADALYTLEREGVAVADSTSILQYLISRKDYIDMTGDFLCHPNDFANRVFVQSILATLKTGSDDDYISGLANRITKYRYQWEFDDADWSDFCAIAEEGRAAILTCSDKDAAREKYIEYTDLLDAVPTSADNVANSKIDVANLIFNTAKPTEIVSAFNVSTKHDNAEKALYGILTARRNATVTLDYTKGDTTASADDYNYVVVTMKTPLTNNSKATQTKLTYATAAGTCTAVTVDLVLDGKYHSYVIDMSGDANWTGDITTLTITPFVSAALNDAFMISSIVLAADSESANDIAIERARIANNDAAEAVTYLMADEATSAILTTPQGASYLAGDVDGNGKVSAVDSLFMRKYLASPDFSLPNPVALDADASGDIDASDLLIVRQTIAGIIPAKYIDNAEATVSYSAEEKAAKIVLGRDNAVVTADLSDAGLSADMFKYVTVCAKHENGQALGMTVTLTYTDGSAVKTVEIPSTELFAATVAKFVEANGDILSISFTLDAKAGETVYFDSFVLTPTASAAENAVAVRVGAANLF